MNIEQDHRDPDASEEATMSEFNEVAKPYVHVLLFECQNCGCPVPSALTSEHRNVEDADTRAVKLNCYCGWSGRLSGTDARWHWVEQWHSAESDSRYRPGASI
jgi:hypothetical protein